MERDGLLRRRRSVVADVVGGGGGFLGVGCTRHVVR